MTGEPVKPIEVFISYDRKDKHMLRELEKRLHPLEREGFISVWSDSAIHPGQESAIEIERHLHSAELILLLISPDFIASDKCCKIEVVQAMKKHETGAARVIPIILRPVSWEDQPFSKLQVLPKEGRPVKRWSSIDEAFLDISKNIRNVISKLLLEYYPADAEESEESNEGKQGEEALIFFDKIVRLGLDSAFTHRKRGDYFLGRKKYEEALMAYEAAMRLDPSTGDTYFYQSKGHALRNLERYEEALAAYKEAIRLGEPHPDPSLYYYKGSVLECLAQQAYEIARQFGRGSETG